MRERLGNAWETLGGSAPGEITASDAPERRSIFAQGQETKASRADAAFGAIPRPLAGDSASCTSAFERAFRARSTF